MKRGILLMNIGSPSAPNETAVRSFLKAFLMDPYVIDLPLPLRYLLVHKLILPLRPKKTAKAYQKIWTQNGSPLVHYSTQLAKKLNVEIGMAYGEPSYKNAIERLLQSGVDEIALLPLFPHQAQATTGSCIAAVQRSIKNRVPLRVSPPFYQDPSFIQPLAAKIQLNDEHLLFSYHGLPIRHLKKMNSPTYLEQCMATTHAIVRAANLSKIDYSVAFQSRLGRTKWMEPYTEETLRALPQQGIKKLAVISPSFFCDGLETLEEIEQQGKSTFMNAGGTDFRMIPCLNHSAAGITCINSLLSKVDSWPIYF